MATPAEKQQAAINRNDTCPCGSGKKYKHCCMGKESASRGWLHSGLAWKGAALLVLVAALIALGVDMASDDNVSDLSNTGSPSTSGTAQPPTQQPVENTTGSTPAPWEYNAQTNQHWHPGHGHWHDGQPPPPSQRTTGQAASPLQSPNTPGNVQSASTPAPWFYNQQTDQHWHPDHGHWHDGPPPPQSQR